ncbi:hypothetical protein PHISCL_06504 [Aspergillus sclerotialis]|uniref:Uncharacterized protein n=1 Tax=Aspergillus sclerotialis TaxID=2070753 RepID=A0A3A2ZDD6_9EURO|nr:hypothetical protein PHISCL_06504 [Aspergillus sclerotialis]
MSHPLVAAVWEQLGRHDVANILREIMGEHAAELAVLQVRSGLVSNIEPVTRMVFWVKAIFDLQRTYLQGVAGVSDCHPYVVPYLLSSETVYSTLMYLVRVKSELFPSATATILEFAQYRYFLAQTLLAGVRVLLLRGEGLLDEMKGNLEHAIRVAWNHPGLSNAEQYLVNNLLPGAIGRIGSSEVQDTTPSVPTPGTPILPTFVSGLYPFQVVPEALILNSLTTITGEGKDPMTSFWTLFDIIWAAEAALIQCYVDHRRLSQDQSSSSKAGLKLEDAFDQVEESRKKLLSTILVASDDFSVPLLQVISDSIFSQFANDLPPAHRPSILESWQKFHNIRTVFDSSLGHLVRWLINRRVQLWDCNGELEAVSREYQQNLTQWLHGSSQRDQTPPSRESERRGDAVYVVNCPAVHPVPRTSLEERLKGSDRKGYEMLLENVHFLTLDIACPLCPGNTRIQHARMIEPLEQLSNVLSIESEGSLSQQSGLGSGSRIGTSRSSSLSHSTSHSSAHVDSTEPLRSPVSPTTPNTSALSNVTSNQSTNTTLDSLNTPLTPSISTHSQEKQTFKSLTRDLKSVKVPFSSRQTSFRKSAQKHHPLPRQPQFAFSASGKSLLFWGDDANWIMRFGIPCSDRQRPQTHRYDVSGVQYAAAGDKRCAAIASVGEHYELLVFESTSITAYASLAIDTQRRSLPSICMVMSRDDKYIAFTLKDQVHIYEIGARTIRKVTLDGYVDTYPMYGEQPTTTSHTRRPLSAREIAQEEQRQKSIIERKLQFSVDGMNLIVVTHFGNQYASVDIWDCVAEPWSVGIGRSRSFKLPPWTTNDGDLTSIFYDNTRNLVFLAAYLGKDYPVLFSMSDTEITSDPFSTRILHAAQSPSGSQYAIVNGMTEIYLCDYKSNNTLNPCRMKKAASKISSSAFKPGHMVLALPQENHLLAFWVKGEKLMLRTVGVRDGSEVVSDFDLRADFDAVVGMARPPSGGFQLQPRRQSLVSIVEMEASPYVPRPGLAELPSRD